MSIRTALLCLAAACGASTVSADGWEVGVSYTRVELAYHAPWIPPAPGRSFEPTAVVVEGAWEFGTGWDLVGRIGTGVADDGDADVSIIGVDVKSLYGIYVRPRLALGERVEAYAIGGFTRITYENQIDAGLPYPDTGLSKASLGAGVRFGFGDGWKASLELAELAIGEEGRAISFGVSREF